MNLHIKYRQLRALTLVAEHGSFRAAADRLAVSQSSLSTLIKELESDLGVSLFNRTTRSCSLTEAGSAFYEEIKGSLDRLDDAYRHAKEVGVGNRGKLRLAAQPSLCSGIIVNKLAEFQQRFPGVRVSLAELDNEKLIEAVRRGDVEIGIGRISRRHPELVFKPLFTDQLMIVAPKKHPLLKMPAEWKSLAGFPLIYMAAGTSERALRMDNISTEPALEVAHASTALAMVRHGMGIAVLPSSIMQGFQTAGIECRPIAGKLAERELGIVSRRNSVLSAPATAFTQLLLTTKAKATM